MTFSLCLIFFLSGAAALLFETLWFYQAGLALGNSVWASSLVLAGFMGGLAIGNGLMGRFGHHVRRPVRLYALIEVIIGATGLVLVHLLPRLTPLIVPLLRPFLDSPWMINLLRLAIAFPLLLIPSSAMGATLPLLVAALFRRDPHFGRVLGRLYGWNTLGAVVGAVAGEVALIEWFGIFGTGLVAALLNGIAALAAFGLARPLDVVAPSAGGASPARLSKPATSLLAAAFLSGGILLALEVVWFRLLLLFVHGDSRAFAIMLSLVLAGIGTGGLVGSRWLSRRPGAYRFLPAVALGNGVLCILAYVILDVVLRPFQGLIAARWHEVLQLSLPLMFPVSLCSGVLFTLLGEALNHEVPVETRSAGLLTLSNTTGAMLGSLAAAFLLLPGLGIERSIRLLAGSYGIAAVFLLFGGMRPARRHELVALSVSACLLVLAYSVFPSGFMEQRYLVYRLKRHVARGTLPVEIREGLTETAIYLREDRFGEPMYYQLLVNSTSMSSTNVRSLRYMKLFVYLPVALHPNPRDVLLLCYGAGLTAKALTETSAVKTIDVVDISSDLMEMSRIVYPDPQEHPLNDPRVTVHIEDARHFLQVTDRRFDLITGEPPPPKYAGIVNLYTREYFDLIWNRLAEGGFVTYWLPVHSLLEQDTKAILRAFCEVFEDCSLWGGAGLDWVLLGSRTAQGPGSEERFTQPWRDPVVGPELRALGFEVPAQLGSLFMADADHLQQVTAGTKPLRDNYPKRLSSQHLVRAKAESVYHPWMRVKVTRERFLHSHTVKRLLPESLRTASAAYFDIQDSINRYFLDGPRDAVAALPTLHHLLRGSPLRTLPLWLLGSSVEEQRVAATAVAKGWHSPALDYQLGVGALADRNYTLAEAYFRAGQAHGTDQREFLYYRIYALCMLGRLEEAWTVVEHWGLQRGQHEDDRDFLRFISETFGLR